MVFTEVILQQDVDWTIIPNTRVVKNFPKVKHFPHGPLYKHQGIKIEIQGQTINPHRIELSQQIGQPTPNTNGMVGRVVGPPLQMGWLKPTSQIVDLVSPPKAKREVISTLSPHVLASQPTMDVIMLPTKMPLKSSCSHMFEYSKQHIWQKSKT
jgi:hypothetical protein